MYHLLKNKIILALAGLLVMSGGYVLSTNKNDGLIEGQQKQIEELSAKLDVLSASVTSSEKEELATAPATTASRVVERIVKVKDDSASQKIEVLEAKLKEFESKQGENTKLIVSGDSNSVDYTKFIKNIVQVVCLGGNGSGTITSPGTILTNYHVVEGSNECYVKFTEDPSKAPSEKILGKVSSIDPLLDRAVIVIDSALANLSITKCNAENTKIADELVIMGYPGAGGNTLTITEGIISGFDKQYIKTSAKINPGNSGGAAIHKSGCYLGIPTAVNISGFEAIGLIVDERNGGSGGTNDGLLDVGNQIPSNKSQEEIKMYLEQKEKYDTFVTESKFITDQYKLLYESKVLRAIRLFNSGDYATAGALLQTLHKDFEEIRTNHLYKIQSVETIPEVAKFKQETDTLIGFTKEILIADLDEINYAVTSQKWALYDEYREKINYDDIPKVDRDYAKIQKLMKDAKQLGDFHFYR